MIERKCETCDIDHGRCISRCLCNDCQAPDRPKHIPSRDALEAEVERLEACLRGAEDATDAAREERDAAISRASEERAARCGLEEQLAESERQRDELRAQAEDWAAQYRALSASVESERAGLRHSLSEVEDELEECRKERDEARAAARVACSDDKQEHERMREVCRERDHLQKRVSALEDQIEHAGCAAAHLGERTLECRIEAPCGLCRLRARAEAAEAEVSRLGSTAFAYRMRAYGAESRVRELEAQLARLADAHQRLPQVSEELPSPI